MLEKRLELNEEDKNSFLTKIRTFFKEKIVIYSLATALMSGGVLGGCGTGGSNNQPEDDYQPYQPPERDGGSYWFDGGILGQDGGLRRDGGILQEGCQPCQTSAGCPGQQLCFKWAEYPSVTWCADPCSHDSDCPDEHSCGNSNYCRPLPPGSSDFESSCQGSYVVKKDSCDHILERTYCPNGCSNGSCLSSSREIPYDDIPDEVPGSDLSHWNANGSQCKLPLRTLYWNLLNHTQDISDRDSQDDALSGTCGKWAGHISGISCTEDSNPRVRARFYSSSGYPCGSTIACANYPCTNDQNIRFNDGYEFTLNLQEAQNSNKIDLFSASLHEWGHIFGLPHTDDYNAVMYKAYTRPKRALTRTDINMLCGLYGNNCQ